VNSRHDTLFELAPPVHNARVNILFGDLHVRGYAKFSPGEMTYACYVPGLNFQAREVCERGHPLA